MLKFKKVNVNWIQVFDDETNEYQGAMVKNEGENFHFAWSCDSEISVLKPRGTTNLYTSKMNEAKKEVEKML